jgi:hydroxyacylglutathione hydrolase
LLIHDETTGDTAAIDTPDAAAYDKVLKEKGWTLTHILNTQVYGPATEQIPNRHVALKEGDTVDFGSPSDANANQLKIMDVGGHTKGHIAFYNSQVEFVGDSLFALGCGRMFEGTPTQF